MGEAKTHPAFDLEQMSRQARALRQVQHECGELRDKYLELLRNHGEGKPRARLLYRDLQVREATLAEMVAAWQVVWEPLDEFFAELWALWFMHDGECTVYEQAVKERGVTDSFSQHVKDSIQQREQELREMERLYGSWHDLQRKLYNYDILPRIT